MAAANSDFCAIDHLPDPILLEIFLRIQHEFTYALTRAEYIDFPCRKNFYLPPAASVCTRWRRLYFDAQMWRNKVINLRYVNQMRHQSQFFAGLNQMAGEIRNLEVSGLDSFAHGFVCWPLLPTFPAVEQLILDIQLPPGGVELLVEKFPAVKSVTIDDRQQLDDDQLLQMAEGWENLRKFHIWTRYERRTNVTAAGLIRFVTVANHIESFTIGRFPIKNLTDSKFDKITQRLGVGLKYIRFGEKLKKLSEFAIDSLVRNCPNLEQICLEVPLPIGRFKDLAKLKNLSLRFYGGLDRECPDCPGIEQLFSRPLSHLRSFEANGVGNLTDSLLELIANSCPQLESLSLTTDSRSTTDSGVAHIINNCRNLRVLCLEGFYLLTGRSFIGAGAKLSNLSRLELRRCENIDAEMVRRAFVRSTRLQIKTDLDGSWDDDDDEEEFLH